MVIDRGYSPSLLEKNKNGFKIAQLFFMDIERSINNYYCTYKTKKGLKIQL